MEHKESNPKIYYTTEYGRFKFLKGNRDINELKVKKIREAINNGIDILKYAPVIVNERMEIIDGQHRFAVAKELKSNVYYVIHAEADLSIVPAINSKSSKWRNIDFLNSYCDLKKQEYLQLAEFIHNYPVNLPTAIKLLHSGLANKSAGAIEAFRDGELECKYLKLAEAICQKLQDFQHYCDNPFSGRMIDAMRLLMDNGKYNHDLMVKKLEESGRHIENVTSVKTIIQDLESIINHKSRSRIIIH